MSSLAARLAELALRLVGPKRMMNDASRFARTFGQTAPPAEPGWATRRRLSVSKREVGGHVVFAATPHSKKARRHILYLHGGAYVQELAAIHWRMVTNLVERTGATATIPVYPLAPDAGWTQMSALVRTLLDELAGDDGAGHVSLVGDSSGAGLALSAAMQLRDEGAPLPSSLVLFSPWLDLTVSDADQRRLDRQDPMLGIPGLRAAGLAYAGAMPAEDPRVSPLFGSFASLPPTLVLTGTHDVLNSDARRAALVARKDNADFTLREYPDMIHVWPALPIPEAKPAFDEAASFIMGRWRS